MMAISSCPITHLFRHGTRLTDLDAPDIAPPTGERWGVWWEAGEVADLTCQIMSNTMDQSQTIRFADQVRMMIDYCRSRRMLGPSAGQNAAVARNVLDLSA